MLYYDLEHAPERSLYEALTAYLRRDIQNGTLLAGSRLPSKRRAAADLGVSIVTVQSAYDQLVAEGYLIAEERRGYFVADIASFPSDCAFSPSPAVPDRAGKESRPKPGGADGNGHPLPPDEPAGRRGDRPESPLPDGEELDLVQGALSPEWFPLSVWSRLSNRVCREQGACLLRRMPYNGLLPLREAIAEILRGSRGIVASPDQMVISAGNEQLYFMLLSYFGRGRVFGAENPGHRLITRLYRENGATVRALPMDEWGVIPEALEASDTEILHISPSHHFPTGIVMPIARRQALLAWVEAKPGRFIIEDDYDSEFRMAGRPIPSLQHLDRSGRVLYINTFSKTVAPALRIAYAVLPPAVSEDYRNRFGFLTCPVAAVEQLILSDFIREGYFERQVNRMRTRCRRLRDELLSAIALSPRSERYTVSQADSGLHFLLHIRTSLPDRELVRTAGEVGLKIRCLSDYADPPAADTGTFVVSYAGLFPEQIPVFVRRLDRIG